MARLGHNNLQISHPNVGEWFRASSGNCFGAIPPLNGVIFVAQKGNQLTPKMNGWVEIGARAMADLSKKQVKELLETRLGEAKLFPAVHVKSFEDYMEIWIVYSNEPAYKDEIKTCEIFAKVEDRFKDSKLELRIVKQSDYDAINQ